MPDYEYECQKCGHVTTVLRGFTQRDEPCKCECCGSSRTKRYYSPVRHEWSNAEHGLPPGMSYADAMSITEKAKKERGVMKDA